MRLEEYFKISIQTLKRRRLRSWLTMIGIFIGIAAVVSLISLSQGMDSAIKETFEDLGSDKIYIQPKASFGSIGENIATEPLTEDDVAFIRKQTGIDSAFGMTIASAKIEYQDNVKYYSVFGIPTDSESIPLVGEMYGQYIETGRSLQTGDKTTTNIGFFHAERGLYDGKNMELGSKFSINGEKFTVSGIYEPFGNGDDDKIILIPLETFRELTGIEERVDYISAKISVGEDITVLAEDLERSLRRYRDVEEGKEDFTIQTPEDILESLNTILNIVQAVFIGIALVSLFVGGIGIMNTMYTSVVERNRDIGIMKAIGAKNKDIFMLFFVESGVLGVAGGLIGIGIGVGLAKLVEIISEQALGKTYLIAHFSLELFIGALLFSFIVGALAGTLPARQAAKLQPVETLRDE